MDNERPFGVINEAGINVVLPSGENFPVITETERAYLEDKIKRYLDQNRFSNVVDLLDIDKLVTFELLIHRWTMFLSKGKDYWNQPVTMKQTAELVDKYSGEVRQLKKQLMLDKVTREKSHGEDSIPAFWDDLKRRAATFVYMRNQQFQQILSIMHRLKSFMIFYEKCNEEERIEHGCTEKDVLDMLRECIGEFDEIDDKYKREEQTYWVRKQ